jgi:Ca2+-binding EF-hand superfamily protein
MTLTRDNIQQLTKLFQLIDTDGSGTIDIAEICAFWNKITLGRANIKPETFRNDFAAIGKKLTDKLKPAESFHFLIDAACVAAQVLTTVIDA